MGEIIVENLWEYRVLYVFDTSQQWMVYVEVLWTYMHGLHT